jgi:hypothetical protein
MKKYIPAIVFIIGLILLLTAPVHASIPEEFRTNQSQSHEEREKMNRYMEKRSRERACIDSHLSKDCYKPGYSRGEDKLITGVEKDGDWDVVQRFIDSMNSQEKNGAVGMIVLIVFIVALFSLIMTIVMHLKSERREDSKEVQKDYKSIEP